MSSSLVANRFLHAEDGIRDRLVTGVQTCALPICADDAFKAGDRVRVKNEERAGHVRTPSYVRGKLGWIQRVHGEFRDPEKLAYGADGLPRQPLYMVGFRQSDLW